jgi:proteasome activator subunit 4
MLFLVVVRSLCDDDRRLMLQEPRDKFTTEIELTDTSPAFTQQYLHAFRQPIPEKQEDAMLQDSADSGWFVWGKTMEVSRFSAWSEEAWTLDAGCKPGVNLLIGIMSQEGWWQKVRIG